MTARTELATGPLMSLADYERLPEDTRVEYVDGRLLVSPGPDLRHQKAAYRLAATLEPVLPADLDVALAWSWRVGGNEFIPDVVVLPRAGPCSPHADAGAGGRDPVEQPAR